MDLVAGDAVARLDLDAGCRLAQLRVGDLDLLVDIPSGPTMWGCFPMAPWAGRVRHGRFAYDGAEHQLTLNLAPHAMHGTVFERSWQVEEKGPSSLVASIDLGPGWPFAGTARQRVDLTAEALTLRLEVDAASEAFPASLGWHPWFRRRLKRGEPVELDLTADGLLVRDGEGLPSGEVRPGPLRPAATDTYDDCFTGVSGPVGLRWPGALTLTMRSTCTDYVVFTEPVHAVCVEPQTGPPDALNRDPTIVRPGTPLVAETVWRWGAEPGRT